METPTFIDSYQTNSDQLCDDLIGYLEDLLSDDIARSTTHFMDGQSTNNGAKHRKDLAFNIGTMGDVKAEDLNTKVHELLAEWVPKYVEKYVGFSVLCENIGANSTSCKLQKTEPKGGFHKWHFEHGPDTSSLARVLTWTLYLNDFPEGEAETEFLEYGVKVTPKKGLLCLFPAGWTHIHRGNPVYSHTKYIATGWYYMNR